MVETPEVQHNRRASDRPGNGERRASERRAEDRVLAQDQRSGVERRQHGERRVHWPRHLRWTEWLEMITRGLMIAMLLWFGIMLRDVALLRQHDSETAAWTWAETKVRQIEIIRVLKAICLSSVTVYDAARGACEPTGTAEIKPPAVPALKKAPTR